VKTPGAKPPKVVRYEGETKMRIHGQHEPPLDGDGKPKKPIEQRDMTPREHMAYSRTMWAQRNKRRSTPSLLGRPS
jgi:hypothetical protein